jgi:hypothetical protein
MVTPAVGVTFEIRDGSFTAHGLPLQPTSKNTDWSHTSMHANLEPVLFVNCKFEAIQFNKDVFLDSCTARTVQASGSIFLRNCSVDSITSDGEVAVLNCQGIKRITAKTIYINGRTDAIEITGKLVRLSSGVLKNLIIVRGLAAESNAIITALKSTQTVMLQGACRYEQVVFPEDSDIPEQDRSVILRDGASLRNGVVRGQLIDETSSAANL